MPLASRAADHLSAPAKSRRRSNRWLPPGYISISDLAALGAAPRSTLYHYVRSGRLAACQWRGRIVVCEEVARDLLRDKPQPLLAGEDRRPVEGGNDA